tara:strand:- start:480 stop:626 length:147 start_codon:yes stop_codon:yes gene_type:complete
LSNYFKNSDDIEKELIDALIEQNKRLEAQSRASINKLIQKILDDLSKD